MMLNSDVVIAYRTARARARQRTTVRLLLQQRRLRREAAGAVTPDGTSIAHLTAVVDELRVRGRHLPPVIQRTSW